MASETSMLGDVKRTLSSPLLVSSTRRTEAASSLHISHLAPGQLVPWSDTFWAVSCVLVSLDPSLHVHIPLLPPFPVNPCLTLPGYPISTYLCALLWAHLCCQTLSLTP